MGQTKRDFENYINTVQYQFESARIDMMISTLRRSYEIRLKTAEQTGQPLQLTFEDLQYLDITQRLDWHFDLNAVPAEVIHG